MSTAPTGAKRAEILEVSRELLQTRGMNAFSHRDLAERVGVKSSTVHYYFPTKEDIGLALMREYRAEIDSLFEMLEGTADPRARLKGFFKVFEQTAASKHQICMAGMLASDHETIGAALRAEVQSFYVCVERWLAAQASALDPLRTTAESSTLAKLAFSALEGALLSARLFGQPDRVRLAGRSVLSMLGGEEAGQRS